MRQTVCAVALALVLAFANAAVEQAPQHILTNMPPPSADISTGFFFPNNPDNKFPAGKLVDIAVGFHNEGSETFNISVIAGSLNSPADFSLHLQNFTQMPIGQTVAPGEQVTVEYKFLPDPRVEPRDWTIALTAFYSDSQGNWYSSTFFNQTVNIVEVKKLVDWELLFLIVLFAGALGFGAWKLYNAVASLGWVRNPKKRSRSRRAAGSEPVVMTAEDHEEWVKGTPYDTFRKRTAKAVAGAKKK